MIASDANLSQSREVIRLRHLLDSSCKGVELSMSPRPAGDYHSSPLLRSIHLSRNWTFEYTSADWHRRVPGRIAPSSCRASNSVGDYLISRPGVRNEHRFSPISFFKRSINSEPVINRSEPCVISGGPRESQSHLTLTRHSFFYLSFNRASIVPSINLQLKSDFSSAPAIFYSAPRRDSYFFQAKSGAPERQHVQRYALLATRRLYRVGASILFPRELEYFQRHASGHGGSLDVSNCFHLFR